jgi:hypothetical protein
MFGMLTGKCYDTVRLAKEPIEVLWILVEKITGGGRECVMTGRHPAAGGASTGRGQANRELCPGNAGDDCYVGLCRQDAESGRAEN